MSRFARPIAVLSVDLDDKVNKRAKFWHHFSVLQPNDMPRARLRLVVRQQCLQAARRDILGDELGALHYNARACQRCVPDSESIIDLKAALDVDVHVAFGPKKTPARSLRPIRKAQAVVVDEI